MSRLFSALKKCTNLDEALLFVRKLVSLYGKLVVQTFETLFREALLKNAFYDRESHTTVTIVRS